MTTKTISLTIADRVGLSRLLPASGSRIEMMMSQSFEEFIAFTAEEVEVANIKHEGGFISYTINSEKEFEFSPEQLMLIQEGISQADKERRVTRDLLPLIDKIEELVNNKGH